MPDSTAIAWSHCPPAPWLWLQLREPLLAVGYQPWLLGPLLGLLVWWIARRPLPVVVAMVFIAVLYSPIGTTALSAWLQGQLPPSVPAALQPVAVLLGRGPQIAAATTAFRRQGLVVLPIAVEPPLSAGQRNRLALRETAATLLYGLQGRL